MMNEDRHLFSNDHSRQMVADFFKEYKPLEILDMTIVGKVLHYKVKADGRDELDLMPADIMKEKFPQVRVHFQMISSY